MSRKKRIWYPGASYHVMSRGIRRSAILKDQADYEMFCMILKNTMEKGPFKLHSFCMMTNHLHMQITTINTEIWKIMNHLLCSYAKSFNHRYGYTGHLFESRYTSCLIDDPVYFLEVSRYIHLNPVRAGMVREPLDYPYSSYGCYVSQKSNPLLEKNEILSFFANDSAEQYRMFVEGAVSHGEHELLIQKDMGEDENWLPW
ncbi:MAG: transposase [Agathobacter sp.]